MRAWLSRRPWLGAVLLTLMVAVVMTGRLWTPGPPERLLGGGEAPDWTGTVWAYWWTGEALLSGHSPFAGTANFFPVGKDPISQYNLFDALLAWPLVQGLGPAGGYNAFIFLCVFTNGLAVWWLCRHAGASAWSSGVGAVGFQLAGFLLTEVAAGRITQVVLAPFVLGLIGLDRLARGEGSWRTAVWTGACVTATTLTYWYYGFFLVMAGAVLWLATARQWDRDRFAKLGLAAGMTALVCLPLVASLASSYGDLPGVQRTTAGTPPWGPEVSFHVGFASLQGLWPGFWLWAGPGDVQDRGISLFFVAVALFSFRGGRPWRWLAVFALGYALVLGPYLNTPSRLPTGIPMPFLLLMEGVPFFERLWWPDRAMPILLCGLAVLAALGVDRGAKPERLRLASVGLVLVMALETSARHGIFPLPMEPGPPYAVGLYERLDGPLLTTPVLGETGSTDGRFTLWMQVHHEQPILGGLGDVVRSHSPPAFERYVEDNSLLRALREVSRGTEELGVVEPADVQRLLDDGFVYAVVDRQTFSRETRREAVAAHRRIFTAVFGAPVVQTRSGDAWRIEVPSRPVTLPRIRRYLPEGAGDLLLPEMRKSHGVGASPGGRPPGPGRGPR